MNTQSMLWGRYALFLVFAYVALMTAWLSDDSLITLRQVWNFVHGDGLTFNFGERVQAFSHPAWFLAISSVVALTKEPYFTVLFFSIAISLSAIALLLTLEFELMRGRLSIISPIVFLLFSIAFCDYLTSGLENPLSFLLIAIMFRCFLPTFRSDNAGELPRKKIFLILSLLVLTRFDYAVLFFPLFVFVARSSSGFKTFIGDVSVGRS